MMLLNAMLKARGAIAFVLLSEVAVSNPNVTVKTNYYTITGSTAQQLRQQMNQKGHIDPLSGRRYDAYTGWQISWYYNTTLNNNQCKLHSAKVNTTITFTLPQWKIPSNASQALQTKWNKYINALIQHEKGHEQNGILASNEILQRLQTIPSNPSCETLKQNANQLANQVIKKYNQKDITYDKMTKHGITQGAIFP